MPLGETSHPARRAAWISQSRSASHIQKSSAPRSFARSMRDLITSNASSGLVSSRETSNSAPSCLVMAQDDPICHSPPPRANSTSSVAESEWNLQPSAIRPLRDLPHRDRGHWAANMGASAALTGRAMATEDVLRPPLPSGFGVASPIALRARTTVATLRNPFFWI